MTLKVEPIALGGKLLLNLANTPPVLPCDLLTRPQIVLNLLSFCPDFVL